MSSSVTGLVGGSAASGTAAGASVAHEAAATTVRLARAMLRPALLSTLAAGVITVVVATVLAGLGGAVAAVSATALVIACGWLTVAVMRWTATAQPMVVMSAGVAVYCIKFLILLGLLLVLRSTDWFDVRAFGLSVLGTVCVWTLAELLGFVRARVATVTPPSTVASQAEHSTTTQLAGNLRRR